MVTNIIIAFLVSIVFEMTSLLFTDNQMYGQDGYVVPMRIINWFRSGIWFGGSLVILCQWKKIQNFLVDRVKAINRKLICNTFITETGLFLSGFMIMKIMRVRISRYHIIFLICFSLFIITEIYYCQKIIHKVENMFFIVALIASGCYIFTTPVFVIGGDQGIHFNRTVSLAQSYREVNFGGEYDSYNEEGTNVLVEKVDNIILNADEEPVYTYIQSKPFILSSLRYIAYIPPAAVLAIADAINLSPTEAYFAGQCCNAIVYIFLIYLGVRKLKAGKLVLIVFASLPRILFLATRYSYTPWVIAWITFASAYIIGELQEVEKSIEQKDTLIIAGTFLLGILVKAPYFTIVPLAFLISKHKFKDLKVYKQYIVLMIGTMLILFMTLIIPVFLSEKGFDIYSDIRGGSQVNAFEQMKFILTHSVKYTGILLSNIGRLFSFSVFVVGKDGFTGMRAGMSGALPTVVFLLFVWVVITDKKIDTFDEEVLKKRIFVFLLTFVNICWICTVMYMNYSEVGVEIINGCNPMYLMDFMFPLFYYCRSRHVHSDFNWRKYNAVVYGGVITIMFITIYVRVINLYI